VLTATAPKPVPRLDQSVFSAGSRETIQVPSEDERPPHWIDVTKVSSTHVNAVALLVAYRTYLPRNENSAALNFGPGTDTWRRC
jgi:hypothetical protein